MFSFKMFITLVIVAVAAFILFVLFTPPSSRLRTSVAKNMELYLTIVQYGSNERRVEIDARPPIPANVQGNVAALDQWSQQLVMSMWKDLKHSEWWECSECGLPARETLFSAPSWIHLPQPRMNLYIFHLCSAGGGPCHMAVESLLKDIARQTGQPYQSAPVIPGDFTFPLTATCAACNADATGERGFSMSRCGACKLTRYCSPNCQKGDWSRHKKACKSIKKVKWVGW